MMTKEQYEKFCKDAENMKVYDGRGTFDLYECDCCPNKMVTTYAAKGVTPFTMRCKKCGGVLTHKETYRYVSNGIHVIKFVRPTYEQYTKLSDWQREHVEKGGLILEKEIGEVPKNVKIFGSIVEEEARQQIEKLANYEPYKNATIRIMPDVHAGKGCTIGTTMTITDAITPNLVGVDIGCGMYVVPLGKVDIDLEKFDKVVNEKIPSGFNIHDTPKRIFWGLNMLRCREVIDFNMAQRSIGTLGGGNHFIELNEDEESNKYLVIHSGSRNLGVRVCQYYQKIAEKNCQNSNIDKNKIIAELKAQGRENEIQDAIKALKPTLVDKDLAHLTGEDMQNYLHDMDICQRYAELNRETIADLILTEFDYATCYATETPFHTIHNYIDLPVGIKMLRKGAVAAYRGQLLIIPMNMRDGSLLCVGKGNIDWNYSAPHGAGRLMSRKKAKEAISMAEFEKSMNDVYSTSVCESTLDEAPQAYKPMQSIIDAIHDTVDVMKIIKPIYNYKAKN